MVGEMTQSPRLAVILTRAGLILCAASLLCWSYGAPLVSAVTGLSEMHADFWTAAVSGAAFLVGVFAFCLGRYTFSDEIEESPGGNESAPPSLRS
jgi:hypothetical protein